MWFEILAVVMLIAFTVLVVSAKPRTWLLSACYRLLQVLLLAATAFIVLPIVYTPSCIGDMEQFIQGVPLVGWIHLPEGWPENSIWLLRGLALSAAALPLLIVVLFMHCVAQLVVLLQETRRELQAAYVEMHNNIKQYESSGIHADGLGDIKTAMMQMKSILKRG
jgi:hypothetical protein